MDPLIIPVLAIAMPLILVPTIVTLKHRHKRREWEHRERMRAMDGPIPLSRWASPVGSGGVAAIGGGVPVASVLAALLTSLTHAWEPGDPLSLPVVAWGSAVVISIAGLGTSLLLAHLQARTQREIHSAAAAEMYAQKPVMDPDALDVAGCRC